MLKTFKQLPTGVKRAIIVGTIPVAMLFGGIITHLYNNSRYFLAYSILLGIPLYWIATLLGIWIYDGFKK